MSEKVYVENFPTKKPRWIPGTIIKITGPLLYEVELENGPQVRRHADNVRWREENQRGNVISDQEAHPPMLLEPQLSSEIEMAKTPENPDQPGTGEARETQAPEQDPNPTPCRSVFEISQCVMDTEHVLN